MQITDAIADMLTRIRNALTIRRDEVVVPASKTKNAIAEILFNQGYIEKYELVDDSNYKSIKITLKYGPNGEKVINHFIPLKAKNSNTNVLINCKANTPIKR